MANKLRLQFDFSPLAAKDLEKLRIDLGLTSRVDVVKQALGLLQWVVQLHQGGGELITKVNGQERVVVLPSIPNRQRPENN